MVAEISVYIHLDHSIFTAQRTHGARSGRVGGGTDGNGYDALGPGFPKLAQGFISTLSSILPEITSLSTSGRQQSVIL